MENFKVRSLVDHKLKLSGRNGQPTASISSPPSAPKPRLLAGEALGEAPEGKQAR